MNDRSPTVPKSVLSIVKNRSLETPGLIADDSDDVLLFPAPIDVQKGFPTVSTARARWGPPPTQPIMSSHTEIDREELRRRLTRIESDIYRNTDRRNVDDMALLRAALIGGDVDPDDVVLITDDQGDPIEPLEEAVEARDEHLDRKSELASAAAVLAPSLRDYGYDSVEISRMSDSEICRAFTHEVRSIDG